MPTIEIIPAIIPESFDELSLKLGEIAGLASTAHLDINDGIFSGERSWPLNGVAVEHFDALVREKEGLPFWEKLDFEVHLMVAHPETYVADWIKAGMKRIIVHAEAMEDFDGLRMLVGEGVELVLALKLETPLETIAAFAARIDGIHLMTISRIGFQGFLFDPDAVEKVKSARALYPEFLISVDGGVNVENAGTLIRTGASRLVVGSAIFGSENPKKTLQNLNDIAKGMQ